MKSAEQAYQETSSSEVILCRANYPGCTQIAQTFMTCPTEGTRITLCHSCRGTWQLRAKSDAGRLVTRCPACEALALGTAAPRQQPVTAPPLAGAVAQALNEAMHAEGLLEDVRHRVLVRLAHTNSWLQFVTPPVVTVDVSPGSFVAVSP